MSNILEVYASWLLNDRYEWTSEHELEESALANLAAVKNGSFKELLDS